MKGNARSLCAGIIVLFLISIFGCSSDQAKIEQIARQVAKEEAKAAIQEYAKSFAPVKFGFGGALEKEWSTPRR